MSYAIALNTPALFSMNSINHQIALLNEYLTEQDKALLIKEANQFLNGLGSYTKNKTDDKKYEYFCKQIERILIASKYQEKNQFMFTQRCYQALLVTACTLAIAANVVGAVLCFTATSLTFFLLGLFLVEPGVMLSILAINFSANALSNAEQAISREVPNYNKAIKNGHTAYAGLMTFFGVNNNQTGVVDEPIRVNAPVAAQ